MVEILLMLMLPMILLPQIAAGILAKQTGRDFWFWFCISFLIPFISLIVLLMLKDKSGDQTIDRPEPSTIDQGDPK